MIKLYCYNAAGRMEETVVIVDVSDLQEKVDNAPDVRMADQAFQDVVRGVVSDSNGAIDYPFITAEWELYEKDRGVLVTKRILVTKSSQVI